MASAMNFDHYTSSSRGSAFSIEEQEAVSYTPLKEDERVFDKATYEREIHPPIVLFPTYDALSEPLPRCLDMPLRLRGESQYAVPEEWASLLPLIKQVASLEHGNNPSVVKDYFTYMTVDSSWVEKGEVQRREGLHVDGFQGTRISPKTKTTRNYVATSNGGTIFYPQLFSTSIDESVYDLFKGFDLQGHSRFVAPEDAVVFMDAHAVHESGAARYTGWRSFVRVAYDCKEFDRLGNSKNAMLSYDWPMVERDVQSTLVEPTLEDFSPTF